MGLTKHFLPLDMDGKYGVSQFQNPEVFPSHKTVFSPYDNYMTWKISFIFSTVIARIVMGLIFSGR